MLLFSFFHVDLKFCNKSILQLNIPEEDSRTAKLFFTDCTMTDLSQLCNAMVNIGETSCNSNEESRGYELYPAHITCIVGNQDLLAELILALSNFTVFQYVRTFAFLLPCGTKVDYYNNIMKDRFWTMVGSWDNKYSNERGDKRTVMFFLFCFY